MPVGDVTYQIQIKGIVQGVGFRPFVYEQATRRNLRGWVLNDSSGVTIQALGPETVLNEFVTALQREAPPLAHIDALTVTQLKPTVSPSGFTIRRSQAQAGQFVPISPDIATCSDCRRELFEPADRRYRYPFINCTNCGPRFTIIRDTPYDRPQTTMAPFPLCPACRTEYENPVDRRFHAQPNACPTCGPQLDFGWNETATFNRTPFAGLTDPLRLTQAVIAAGGIVAIKGIGGFHLACNPYQDVPVAELRRRKGRVGKPFAVMAANLSVVAQVAFCSPAEARRLTDPAAPIVLLRKRAANGLSDLVAPGNHYLGVMLPYTPLHHLLLADAPHGDLMVLTSANYAEEPIVHDNTAARHKLAALADAFLHHNRDIHIPSDDSVVRVFQGADLPVRRSRGYAPFPVKLPVTLPPTLAVGGELKNTVCLTNGNYAFMSQHIGDMENLETLQMFERTIAHFEHLFRVRPTLLAYDLHPNYRSSRWVAAQPFTDDVCRVAVQHHHAHIAAVMAENGLTAEQRVIGFSFDGTGYGIDGAIWGGEVLLARYADFERAAHLKYVPLPGGDAAVKRPYRTALAYLWAAGLSWDETLPPVAACAPQEQAIIRRQLESGLNSPLTSSMGRLFDAVAALCGVRQTVTYEAQNAIEFEALCRPSDEPGYHFALNGDEPVLIDPAPLLTAVVADVHRGLSPGIIATRFHVALANLMVQLSELLRQRTGLQIVALSGGVFQNVTLLNLVVPRLTNAGFRVLVHRQVPPNDGGLALGQALVANFSQQQC